MGHIIEGDELKVNCTFSGDAKISEGVMRHVVHSIQQLRKQCGIFVSDPQEIFYSATGPFKELLDKVREEVQSRISRNFVPLECKPEGSLVHAVDTYVATADLYANQSVQLYVTQQTFTLAPNQFGSQEFASKVQSYVSRLNQTNLGERLSNGPISFSFAGTDVTLTLGKNIFASALEASSL